MRVCVFEDPGVQSLEPLTLTRPAFTLRCGAFTLFERFQSYFRSAEFGVLVRPTLTDLCKHLFPTLVVDDSRWLQKDTTILVNGRWLAPSQAPPPLTSPQVGMAGDQVAYAVVPSDRLTNCTWHALPESLDRWKQELRQTQAGGSMIDYPWDLVERNGETIATDLDAFRSRNETRSPPQGMAVLGQRDQLHVDASATIEPFVAADTSQGPVIIDREAVVRAFSRLEGPCYVGPGSWLVGCNFRGSSIGPLCRVGGEVEASIIHGHSNKYHGGFLGHSYIGEWVNLAAGTQTSDLRNDYSEVSLTIQGQKVDTRLTKVGSFIGDHTKTALCTLLNTGTVVGAFCNLLPSGRLLPRVIPSFCRYHHGQILPRSDWREMLTTAAKVMSRRGLELTTAHTDLFIALYDQTADQRKQVLREGGRIYKVM